MTAEQSDHPEVRTMLSCVGCGAELEPPVRAPHTVYVKTLYRIGGQGLLPSPHREGRGGRRRNQRGQTQSRSGGGRVSGSALYRV